jgi:hypothetical protein
MEVSMKRNGMLILIIMFALSLTWHTAQAADLKVNTMLKSQVVANPGSPAGAKKPTLKPRTGVVKLSAAVRMRVVAKRLRLPVQLEQLRHQFVQMDQMAQEYEIGVATMPDIQKHCAEQSYSVQDQAAAGCSGNETLDQCMEKLVDHCMANFSTAGVSIGGWSGTNAWGTNVGGSEGVTIPSVSVESFRQAAKQTAAQAKALSQKLNQYASQAERNANAWK